MSEGGMLETATFANVIIVLSPSVTEYPFPAAEIALSVAATP